nr:pseudouridine synthase [Bifidobacterium actinocoloniiforme]
MTSEPEIPFELGVLYEDERIIVVDKPHFLPTTPRGMWYRSSALMRLRERLGEPQITPAHRLDRATAGVLVFVRDPSVRAAYQMLFQRRQVDKVYECLAPARPLTTPATGTIARLAPPAPFPLLRRSYIDKHPGHMQARELRAQPNASTLIDLAGELPAFNLAGGRGNATSSGPTFALDSSGGCLPGEGTTGRASTPYRAYRLHPYTGKTHQLRVHMASLGLPILGDDLYPIVINRPYDDFSHPLQLVARSLSFTDPITGQPMRFQSRVPLCL